MIVETRTDTKLVSHMNLSTPLILRMFAAEQRTGLQGRDCVCYTSGIFKQAFRGANKGLELGNLAYKFSCRSGVLGAPRRDTTPKLMC